MSLPQPTAQLIIQPEGWAVAVGRGQTLLRAALAGGVRLPSSCRNGTCRACICQLLSGTITYQIDWPGLLAEEKSEGWILPCVAQTVGDVVIHAPSASALTG